MGREIRSALADGVTEVAERLDVRGRVGNGPFESWVGTLRVAENYGGDDSGADGGGDA